jgi:hypothetical protein
MVPVCFALTTLVHLPVGLLSVVFGAHLGFFTLSTLVRRAVENLSQQELRACFLLAPIYSCEMRLCTSTQDVLCHPEPSVAGEDQGCQEAGSHCIVSADHGSPPALTDRTTEATDTTIIPTWCDQQVGTREAAGLPAILSSGSAPRLTHYIITDAS